MKKLIFIDLDGTITESKPGIINAIRYAAQKVGVQMPPDDMLDNFIGPPLTVSFEKYMGVTGEENQRMLKEYREYYFSRGLFESSVYDGVEQMLTRLKEAGKKLYVVTAKPEAASKRIIAHFGLDKYFEQVCGASLDNSRSNKAAVIRYALKESNASDLSEVVMIGDRNDDANGAKETGIDCIGVLYGYGSREELEAAGVMAIAKTPGEVADIIISRN